MSLLRGDGPRHIRHGFAAAMKRLGEDCRGVAALEFSVIVTLLVLLLMPITDFARAASQYLQAYQRLREVGAYVQYNPPPDPNNASTWEANIATLISQFGITNGSVTIQCASGSNCQASLGTRAITLSGTITIAPIFANFVPPALAGGHQVSYTENF
jgi:hypothetical protein